jgi:SAM-dependent methyltransferase
MRKFIFYLLIFSALLLIASCRSMLVTQKGYIGFFCTNKNYTREFYKQRSSFYSFHTGDTIVSIGADACTNEAVYGIFADSLHFILENISTKFFNQRQLAYALGYYENLLGKKSTSTYALQIGNDSTTLIGNSVCNTVLIENSFHEFDRPLQMLEDVRRMLRPGGRLLLLEHEASTKGELHRDCKRRLYLRQELDETLSTFNFRFSREERIGKAMLLEYFVQ